MPYDPKLTRQSQSGTAGSQQPRDAGSASQAEVAHNQQVQPNQQRQVQQAHEDGEVAADLDASRESQTVAQESIEDLSGEASMDEDLDDVRISFERKKHS